MGRLGMMVAAGCGAAVLLVGPASTSAANHASWPAFRMERQLLWRWHVRAAARAQSAPTAPVAHRGAVGPASVGVWDLEQIARDTLVGPPGSEPDTQIEPDIALDPNRPSWLVADFQQGRFEDGGSADPGFATSHDGGRHWVHGNLPKLTAAVGGHYWRASDAVVAFGPGHVAYANTLPFSNVTCGSAVALQRSADGGLHWQRPVYLQKDRNCRVINDKNWIAVDTHRGSPHYGRIYAMWDRVFVPKGCNSVKCVLAPIQLRYSDDQGRRWSRRIVVSAARSQGIGVIPLVHRNGDLTAVWINGFTNTVVSQTSTDGGRSWGAPVPISSDLASEPRDMRTGGGLEAAVIDPVTDAMYVAWQDTRLRQDGKNDILLWKSVDEGQSWRSVGRINPPSRLDHLTPGLAAYDNQVSATYLTRSDTSNLVTERFIASQDGGHTFTGERVLNASDLRHAATVFFNGTKFLADYVAIAAWHNVAHPVWCRASTNPDHPREHYHQTTWSATVRLP